MGLPLEGGLLVVAHVKSRALWPDCRSFGTSPVSERSRQSLPSCCLQLNEVGACYLRSFAVVGPSEPVR